MIYQNISHSWLRPEGTQILPEISNGIYFVKPISKFSARRPLVVTTDYDITILLRARATSSFCSRAIQQKPLILEKRAVSLQQKKNCRFFLFSFSIACVHQNQYVVPAFFLRKPLVYQRQTKETSMIVENPLTCLLTA